MYACVTLHYTDVNDDMHDCVTPHDAHSTEHSHSAPCTVLIVILISSTHLAQVCVSPFIPSTLSSTCVCSLRFDLLTSLSSCRPCSSSFSSSSPTRSSWQTCTTPLRRVWTPTTSSPSPHNLWSVNKFARAVAKWTQACDRRLARLISYIHHTNEFRQRCHVGNAAQRCRWGFVSRLRLCWRP